METTLNKSPYNSTKNILLLVLFAITILSLYFIGFESNFEKNRLRDANSYYIQNKNHNPKSKNLFSFLAKNKSNLNQGILPLRITLKTISVKKLNSNEATENFSRKEVDRKDIPELLNGLVLVTPNLQAYNITGIGPKQSVLVTVPYDKELIPVGFQINEIRTYRYDIKNKQWEELKKEGIDPEKNLLYSRTHSDGLMINGIIKSPELPQTESNTPTKIKDLKLADPGSMVQLIEPPAINAQGSANLSYHIEIPKGRQGIEPNLNITYDSDATNGILGEGWNMDLPAITIDTRWGTPKYSATLETESYLLNGEALAFVTPEGTTTANKNLAVPRSIEPLQFYTRRQTNFDKIIRYGKNPKEYWWQITDKKGTIYYYGKVKDRKSGSGTVKYTLVDAPNSKLTDPIGNIAEWRLSRVEDVYDNCMTYNYTNEQQPLNGVPISNNYISSIEYSGWQKEKGDDFSAYNYLVSFVWDVNPNFNFSTRNAVLTGNIRKLVSIDVKNVKFNDKTTPVKQQVRSYRFDYKTNAPFSKTLLTKITQLGNDGNEFNHHDFEYYDDITGNELFGPTITWNSNSQSKYPISSDLYIKSTPNTDATDLGTTKSSGGGYSFYAGVGYNDWQFCNKSATIGIQFGYNSSDTEGLNTLIDIDGDKLADNVFVDGNQISYFKNLGDSFSTIKSPVVGISRFFKENSTTSSLGVSAYFGISKTKESSSNQSNITSYFLDVNADGLVDLVDNAAVYFNRIVDGIPTFTRNSKDTPVPLAGGAIETADQSDTFYTSKSLEQAKENPMHDVVRVWEAPFKGKINIKSTVSFKTPQNPTGSNVEKIKNADGVIATIQHSATNPSELWRQIIPFTDGTYQKDLNDIVINKGEKVFFRVVSGSQYYSNSDFDSVEWSPEIEYTEAEGLPINKTDIKYDVFGQDIHKYNIQKDELFTNDAGTVLNKDRKVKIAMPFSKEVTSDDIRVQIVQYSEDKNNPIIKDDGSQLEIDSLNPADNKVYKKKAYRYTKEKLIFDVFLPADTTCNSICSGDLIEKNMLKDSIYSFRVVSDVNTDFKKVSWKPYLYYHNDDANQNDTIYIIPKYSIKNQLALNNDIWKIYLNTDYKVKPFLKFKKNAKANGNIWFTLREYDRILKKKYLKYTNGILDNEVLDTLNLNVGKELYGTFESDDSFKNNIEEAGLIAKDFENFEGQISSSDNGQFECHEKGKYIMSHNLVFNSTQNQTVKYSVYNGTGNLKAKGILKYINIDHKEASDTISLIKGEKIHVLYENISTPPGVPTQQIIKSKYIAVSWLINADVFYKRDSLKFGPLYRNWGQFAYNDSKIGNSLVPIDIKRLVFKQSTNVDALQTSAQAQFGSDNSVPVDISSMNALDRKKNIFQHLAPHRTGKGYFWQGLDEAIFINEKMQSASRVGLKQVLITNPINNSTLSDYTAYGIVKRNTSASTSSNTTYVVAGTSKSSSNSNSRSDMVDLNADGYPDIISYPQIQFTNALGKLMAPVTPSPIANYNSLSSSEGNHIGGAAPPSYGGNTASDARAKVDIARISEGSATACVLSALSYGSVSKSDSNDYANISYMDMNGDGLSDQVHSNGTFNLNMANTFSQNMSLPGLDSSPGGSSISGSLSFGFNNGNSSISGGIGVSVSRSLPEKLLLDINGDGLTDILEINNEDIAIAINKGDSFLPFRTEKLLNQNDGFKFGVKWKTGFSASAGNSMGGNFTFGFPFGPILPLFKFSVSPGISKSKGFGTVLRQFTDINGDGYIDYLYSEKLGDLKVRLSNIRRTNKLMNVIRPLGGSFKIDYAHNDASYNHPSGKWVLKSVIVNDGVSDDREAEAAAFDSKSTFEYAEGRYDRYEREFLGFGKITTSDLDFNETVVRKHIQSFDNSNYYSVRNLLKDIIVDKDGKPFVETINEYYKNPNAIGKPIPVTYTKSAVYSCPLKYSCNKSYEGNTEGLVLNESDYEYDDHCNNTVFRYRKDGDPQVPIATNYDYETKKTFKPYSPPTGIFGLLSNYVVQNTNRIFREGSATYIDSTGRLFEENLRLNAIEWAHTKYEYDVFGNIVKKTLPNNFVINFTYDKKVGTYITHIEDLHGYFSDVTDIDYRFGIPLESIDMNGQTTAYELDEKNGRISKVWSSMEYISGPKPYTATPTIFIEYDPQINLGRAHSKVTNYDIVTGNKIVTHTYIDGNKRIIQAKKNAIITDNKGKPDAVNNWISNGKILYDALGRVTTEFNPSPERDIMYNPVSNAKVRVPTTTTYDVLDRTRTISMAPEGKLYASYEYAVAGHESKTTEILHNTNPLVAGNPVTSIISSNYFNGSGELIRSELQHKKINTTLIITKYNYDAVHQLESVTRNNKLNFSKKYDIAGRNTFQTNGDGGICELQYNLIGKIKKRILADRSTVEYKYNYDQLSKIEFPSSPQNNVHYYYGVRNADPNIRGRVYAKEDATGAEYYNYDAMGNIAETRKVIVAPFDKSYSFITKFSYDSWNRIQSITYPDDEIVKYNYNTAGLLNSVTGSGGKYVSEIGYDEFEQRTWIKNNNNTNSGYIYDNRRRLHEITTNFKIGSSKVEYKYDNLNNIIKYDNDSKPGNTLQDYTIKNTYQYNDIGQINIANGSWDGTTTFASEFEFDGNLNMIKNNQALKSKKLVSQTNFTYQINTGNNHIDKIIENKNRYHIPEQSNDQYYKENNQYQVGYDEKGNSVSFNKTDLDTKRENINQRKVLYDEENRISAISHNGFLSNYLYDDKGNRAIKLSMQTDNVYLNGQLSANSITATSFSMYVNPYFSTRNGGSLYTKHIYIGSQRVLSKMATRADISQPECSTSHADSCKVIDIPAKKLAFETQIDGSYTKFGYKQHAAINSNEFRNAIKLQYDKTVNPNATARVVPDDITAGLSYYYHSNQINSVNYVTDKEGLVVQHIEYLPYGQTFIEERKGYNSQFKFTGKEEDRESGLSYFGARYYDSKIALWLSVDPMFEKYPGLSPYNYCLGNPIKLMDPDGNEPQNIKEREMAYRDFQEKCASMGSETRWAGAAANVSQAMNEIANPTVLGIGVTPIADFLIYSSPEARDLANKGNKMIYNDAMPKLNKMMENGCNLKGIDAMKWDAKMLWEEQNLIQSLYEQSPAYGLLSAASKQLLFMSPTFSKMKGININPFPIDGQLIDVKQRWDYGMGEMYKSCVTRDLIPTE